MAFQNLKSTGIKYVLTKLKDYFLLIKDAVRTVNNIGPDEYGNIPVDTVPYSQNLETEFAQRTVGSYIGRTAGGSASIEDGDAWLMSVKGNSTHEGYVAESLEMTVVPVDPDAEGAITASIVRATFVTACSGVSGTYTFSYTDNWDTDPSTYGITVAGTPADGDQISVEYVAEERGTIYVANPTGLITTGWNLFDYDNGYARVLKYSDDPAECFGISGTYTSLAFSETLDGAQTAITVTDGRFSIPSDGYVWVTGGNNTNTAIWMTWDDWSEGYDGEFEAYVQYEVDFSNEMATYFPNGLLKAGTVADEININIGQAISRVERITYSDANRILAEASGREYEFDEDFIYLEREEAVTNSITVDGSVTVDDHGMEMITQTDLPVEVEMLYGLNLKNRLERDVVTKSSDVANNLTTTTSGKVLDARQGKVLNDALTVSPVTSPVTWDSSTANTSNCSAEIYKMGKLRIVRIGISAKTRANTWTTYGTISSGNRPPVIVYAAATNTNGSAHVQSIRINTSGGIAMQGNDITLDTVYYALFAYFIT